jgi:hypothetical protein
MYMACVGGAGSDMGRSCMYKYMCLVVWCGQPCQQWEGHSHALAE